jgi:hypothetical protein
MHGNHESRKPGEVVPHFAGDSIVICYNTFKSCRPRVCITIRGEPRQGVAVFSNVYENPSIGALFRKPCRTATVYGDKFLVKPTNAYYVFESDGNRLNGSRVKAGAIKTLH